MAETVNQNQAVKRHDSVTKRHVPASTARTPATLFKTNISFSKNRLRRKETMAAVARSNPSITIARVAIMVLAEDR